MAYNTGLFRNDSPANLHSTDNRVRETDPEVVSAIIQDTITSSAVLQLGNVQRTNSRETVFRLQDTLPEAYWIKGTTDALTGNPNDGSRAAKDIALKQTTSLAWRETKMEVEEMAVMVPLPDAWRADSDVDFSEIRPLIVEAMQKKLDSAVLFGEDLPSSWAANGFHGILPGAIGHGNVVAANDPQFEDLADAIAGMSEVMAEDGYDPTGFVTYPGFKWKLVRLRNADGTPIYGSQTVDGAPAQTIYGQRLTEVRSGIWNTHKDDAYIIAGDWSNLRIMIRQDFEFAVSNSAPIFNTSGQLVLNTFQQDSQVMRVTFRVGATVVNPVKRLGGEYPFSVLAPDADYSS